MLKTIFGKTLFEKRWILLLWVIALFVTNVALIQIFPPIKEAFSGMMESIPPSLQGWFGTDGAMWSTIKGFVSMEVGGQMSLVIMVFAIVFATSLFAAEEASGTLMTQLARPVSRTSYLLQKYLALLVACAAMTVVFWLGAWLGTVILNDAIQLSSFVQPALMVFLLTAGIASLTFAIGAITGNKNLPGVLIGFYAVVGYFITSMRTGAEIVDTLSRFTPFYYYNSTNVFFDGLNGGHVLVLLALVLIPPIIAWPIFRRRDLKTR